MKKHYFICCVFSTSVKGWWVKPPFLLSMTWVFVENWLNNLDDTVSLYHHRSLYWMNMQHKTKFDVFQEVSLQLNVPSQYFYISLSTNTFFLFPQKTMQHLKGQRDHSEQISRTISWSSSNSRLCTLLWQFPSFIMDTIGSKCAINTQGLGIGP